MSISKDLEAWECRNAGTSGEQMCVICKTPITDTDIRSGQFEEVKGGRAHSGCYYEVLGDLVEQHPICPGPH